jgi:hypothetical protein
MTQQPLVVSAYLVASFAAMTGIGLAQTAPPPSSSPAPSASPAQAPSPPPDPCGSLLSIVNRPTVTTGVCTVRTGHFDVETGYTNTTTSGIGGGSSANYPQGLIRIGTANPHFDVELGPPSAETSSVGEPTVTGSSDVSVGAKYEIGYSSAADWGVNGLITFPTGSPAFSAGDPQFTGSLNGAYTVNSVLGIAGSLSFNALSGLNQSGAPQSYFAFIPSLEVTAALPGPSEFFGEYAYFSQAGIGLGGKSLLDFGYIRDLGGHVQFDVEYGFSPTPINGQKQHYFGAGLSFMN